MTPAEVEAFIVNNLLCAEPVQPRCKHCARYLGLLAGVREMIAQHDLAMAWGAELARDRAEAYAAGRRDGIAVGRMQSELVRDVLRAELAYEQAETGSPASDEAYDALEEAVRVYIAAGCPGLEGDDGR